MTPTPPPQKRWASWRRVALAGVALFTSLTDSLKFHRPVFALVITHKGAAGPRVKCDADHRRR